MAKKEDDLDAVIQLLRQHSGEPLTVDFIAKQTGLTWHRVYRIITELILNKVINQYFEVADGIGIIPELTIDGLVFRSQPAKEVA